MRPAGIIHGAVDGDRAHGDGVKRAFLQRGKREVAAGVGHLLRDDGIAGAVGHAHVVGGHVAIGAPGETHAAGRAVEVVDAAGNGVDGRNADLRRADVARSGRGRGGGHGRGRGLHVDGRTVGEEQLLRLHRGHAGDVQAGRILEQLHSRLGDGTEVAGDVGVVVVQIAQAALQVGHAAVGIAALQSDVAAVFRNAGGEEPVLQRRGSRARLPQAQFGLQALDGGDGSVVIGAAGRALQVVQRLEPLVQFAHAVAGVALFQVDIAGAVARVRGVEPLQRLAGGVPAAGETVFLLEQRHGFLRALAVDAVRAVGQVAERAQAILQNGHAQAGVAAAERFIGIVSGEVAAEEHFLQLRRGHAVDGKAAVGEVGLQKAHGILRIGAEDAVGVVVEVAQINEALLQGAHGLAAAAARERAVLLLRLEHIRAGLFAFDRPGSRQADDGARFLFPVGGFLAEIEGGHFAARPAVGFEIFGRKDGVEVDKAAHGLEAQAVQRIAVLGKFGKVTAVEGAQFARLQIDAIDLARAFIQREEAFRAGGELRHARAQRGEHAPRHLRGVELLEAALAGGRGNVIEFTAQSGKVLNAEIDEFHIAGLQRLHAQKAFGAEAQKGLVRIGRGGGHIAGVFGEGSGAMVVQKRALPGLQRGDHALGQQIERGDIAAGRGHLRGGSLRAGAVVDLQAHQRRGIDGGDVIDRVARDRAGAQHVVGQRRLAQVVKVQAHQRAAEIFDLLARQIEDFLFVHMDDLRGVLQRHRALVAGQVQSALAVHIGADAVRSSGQGRLLARVERARSHGGRRLFRQAPGSGHGRNTQHQAQRQCQGARKSFPFHTIPLRFGMSLPFRRLPAGGGSVFCRFSPARFCQNHFTSRSLAFSNRCAIMVSEHMFDKGAFPCGRSCTAT